jgi:hypothetical protein
MHGVNLGTLLRTCDAVGACLAVPRFPWVPEALARGNTLRRRTCVHFTGAATPWLVRQREAGQRILGVELADEARWSATARASTWRSRVRSCSASSPVCSDSTVRF